MEITPDHEMSLVGHLTELRVRLIICLIALAITIVGSFFVAGPILSVLTQPVKALQKEPGRPQGLTLLVKPDGTLALEDPHAARANLDRLSHKHFTLVWPADPQQNRPAQRFEVGESPSQQFYYRNPLDPITMQLKVALIAGLLLALPVLLWQIWLFIKPGLTNKEQRIVRPLLTGAVVLFPLGAAFAFYMIKFVLMVMQMYAVENVDPLLDIFSYLSLLFNMMLIFGVIFEIPLVVAIASRIGLITPKFLQQYRRHAYVVLAIAAMVITPGTDPVSMIVALVPLVALYELSIALAIPMARLHQRDQDADEDLPEESAV